MPMLPPDFKLLDTADFLHPEEVFKTLVEGSSTRAADADFAPADLDKIMAGCAWLRHCRDDAAAHRENPRIHESQYPMSRDELTARLIAAGTVLCLLTLMRIAIDLVAKAAARRMERRFHEANPKKDHP